MEWTGYDNTDHCPDEPRPQMVAYDGYGGDMDYTQNSARAHREPLVTDSLTPVACGAR